MNWLRHRNRRSAWVALTLPASLLVTPLVEVAPASAAYGPPGAPQPNPAFAMPLAGAVTAASTTWATVVMGRNDGNFDLFWQLFTMNPTTGRFALVTPPGVADNGGLMVGPSTSGSTLVGFGASQGLKFSPLALSTNAGKQWTTGGLPDALVAAPSVIGLSSGTQALALVSSGGGQVLRRSGGLTSWNTLTTRTALAKTPAGQSCDIGSLEGVAFDSSATPVIGASCKRPDTPGVFVDSDRQWHLADIPVASSLVTDTFATVRLDSHSALFAAVHQHTVHLVAAWAPTGNRPWSMSPALSVASTSDLLASGTGPGNTQFVVVRQGKNVRALTVAGPGKEWTALPTLPARTATIAIEPGGGIDALSVDVTKLSVWNLDSAASWTKTQTISVPIVFGSSG